MRTFLIFALSTLLLTNLHGQSPLLDSLSAALRAHPVNDTTRVSLLNAISINTWGTDPRKTKDYAEQACVSHSHFRSYFSGLSTAVAIKLRNAVRLCRPIELAELRERFSFEPPQSFLYAQPELRRAVQNECFDLPHRYECLHRA